MVATAISMAAAIEAWWTLETERKQLLSLGYGVGLQAQAYLGQTRESSFGNWIVVSANAPLSASVFFYALPLLTLLFPEYCPARRPRHAGRVVVMPVRAFGRLRGADLHTCF